MVGVHDSAKTSFQHKFDTLTWMTKLTTTLSVGSSVTQTSEKTKRRNIRTSLCGMQLGLFVELASINKQVNWKKHCLP